MASLGAGQTGSAESIQRAIRRHLVFGLLLIFAVFGCAGGWAAVTKISGAVIAPGTLVVEGFLKKVQHPTGGVVAKLLVRDGEQVRANDVLVTLDDTSPRARLAIISNSVDELKLKRARLMAEAGGKENFEIPAELDGRRKEDSIRKIFEQERQSFLTALNVRRGQKSQLEERIKQLEDEIEGIEQQAVAKESEMAVVEIQLTSLMKLTGAKLVPIQRLEEATKEKARLQGERGEFLSNIAQAKRKISETRLQILQVDQDYLAEVRTQVRDTESKLAEDVERLIEAEDQLRRMEIRAPQSGIVYQLAVHTVGGVIAAGETLMMIVPELHTLTVEAHISPVDIDQVFVGQQAYLRLTAFSQRTTPETAGQVLFVSPDLVLDQHSGTSYYVVRIQIDETQAGNVKLLPGMPVETYISTGERTVLSYLVKPLVDQVKRAFRES